MSVPFIQKYHITKYLLAQKLRGEQHYPLVLMLEPLFRCNLACSVCGKSDYSEEILNRRLSVEECLSAVDECGAPVISIAGGEPLIHKDMPKIVTGLVKQKKFIYLCTNGLLLKTHLQDYTPSLYLTLSLHLDGHREWHDALAGRPGIFDSAVEAIQFAHAKGFRFIVNCTFYEGVTAQDAVEFFDFVMMLGAEGITVSPGYSYPKASQKEMFLQRSHSKQLFREIFKLGKGRKWKFNQSSLFLDFLAGNQTYQCTPTGNPTRNVLGWQRPCYLLAESYAPSFRALIEETDWSKYGLGRHPQCTHCMLHSGFEATAVKDTLSHPFKALYVFLHGPGTEGPFAPDITEKQASAICEP